MARMKFLCDADRCIDCNACVTACKNENEVPWGINRRRVVTLNDGLPGERSVSMACMHCTDAPCAAVCPVSCIFPTEEGVVLHSKDLCIGCGYCFYACPFGAPQYPRVGNFGSRGKMDKCTFCAGGGGTEVSGSVEEFKKYGSNRLAQGKLPLCAEMCSTKSLLAGDGDIIAQINSACEPSEKVLNQQSVLVLSCRPGHDDRFVAAYSLKSQKLWDGRWQSNFTWPSFRMAQDGASVAISWLAINHPVSAKDTINDNEVQSQVLSVLDSRSGSLRIALLLKPVVSAGGNFALSADGNRLAVLNHGEIEVYDLPPPAPPPTERASK